MLNDNIVNAVQKMLKKQFTEANGLQDPVLGQGLNFQVYQSIPFIQVTPQRQDALGSNKHIWLQSG